MKNTWVAVGIFAFAISASAANTSVEADNTKKNEVIEKTGAATAETQSNEPADVELTRKIRAEVVSLKDISMNGKNVKIITNSGKVTLRGPVSSLTEKQAIESTAKKLAGAGNVSTYIEVIAR
jgi:osmotically-inducible protein OsmY